MLISTLVIAGALVAFVCGLVYRFVFARSVRAWFGEESRCDHEARRRRRSFEWRVGQFFMWVYISGVCSAVRGIAIIPELSQLAVVGQILALIIAALFAWGATARWREPFAN